MSEELKEDQKKIPANIGKGDALEGIENSYINERTPRFNNLFSGEKVIHKGNAWITLGRDRPADATSGYGGRGDTRAAAIDICVGRMGFDPASDKYGENNLGSFTDGTKPGDAARIYISQRADIDDYFGLCDGSVATGRAYRSAAIGMKADDIRIMARQGVKIVTGRGPLQKDSNNQKTNKQYGIDLIAGNLDEVERPTTATTELLTQALSAALDLPIENKEYLQPLVKGDNLRACLTEMNQSIIKLSSFMTQYALLQMQFNKTVATDFTTGFAGPVPVVSFPSINTIVMDINNTVRTFSSVLVENKFLRGELSRISLNYIEKSGEDYICSRYNRTN
tara:strand:- start:34523 stop:35533 length:1011 start_codon:yes stop_codon:yes gene_type:complete